MAEHEGVAAFEAYIFFYVFCIQNTFLDESHLLLAERATGSVEEDKVVVLLRIAQNDIELIEGRVEDVAPQRPTVVSKVVIAYHGIERIINILIAEGVTRFCAVQTLTVTSTQFILRYFMEVFICIFALELLQRIIQVDIVLGFCVGNVAQVSIEKVVVVESYLQHLSQATGVVGDMAVCSYEEGVIDAIYPLVFVI